jgi:nucleoside-diphosphate-sugar epimerase
MISVFGGTGFIGGGFCKKFPMETIIMGRDEYSPVSNKILYLISTVDNYNVLTDSFTDINTNLIHLMKVLDNCKNKNIEITFISSWFVYGDTEIPANETSRCNPKGFYSITKYSAEMLLVSFCETFGIKYKIIRLANVLGKNDGKISKKKNALQYLINELKENRDINLYYDGEFLRDFIYIDDVIDGIKFIMDYGPPGEIYNLGNGKPIVFKDIINYAKNNLRSTSKIGTMSPTEFHKIVQVKSMYLDTSKLKNLGFVPKRSIYSMIDELVD